MLSEKVLRDIFQPKNSYWKSSITKVEPNRLVTRGFDQEDLIGNISFTELVYLLIHGELPPKNHRKMLQAILVSFCDHGITPPSTQSARLIASSGAPVNACIAGGILAFGKYHAGAIEKAMKTLQTGIGIAEETGESIEEIATKIVDYFSQHQKKVPGFGHRYHDEDPRAIKLVKIAEKYKCRGIHLDLALEVQDILLDKKGIKLNIDGANAGILSDLGFNWIIGCGMFIIGRLPGLLAHVIEEKTMEQPFRKLF